MISRFATLCVTALMPARFKPFLLNLMGHHVDRAATIELSFISVDRLWMQAGAVIRLGNVIRCRRLIMRKNTYLDRYNRIVGPLSVALSDEAAIGRANVVYRAPHPISLGPAILRLGTLSKITSSHLVDCMRSVSIGAYSTVAGARSQLWTHGYKHAPHGPGRYRIEGSINVGDNVYIGSASVVNAGVRIGNGVTVGSHSSVSKSLGAPGLYVSQPLKFYPPLHEAPSTTLVRVDSDPEGDVVFRKGRS